MKKYFVLLLVFSLFGFKVYGQCTFTFHNNLDTTIKFSQIINSLLCPSGDIIFENVNSKPNGSGNIVFDTDVTLNSLTVNYANGNQPAEIIIRENVTVNIVTDLILNIDVQAQESQDKYLTVNGTLIVGGTLDLGNIDFEIDGTGTIDAGDITGASETTCSGDANCPTIIADTCNDGGTGGFCTNDVQPIEMLFFTGNSTGNRVQLKWATASEENFDYFSVERSEDAVNYEVIGKVKGNGWSDNIIHYAFADNNPLAGRAYYRLKATDLDGTFEYFQPVMVMVQDAGRKLKLHKNPVRDNELSFSLNFKPQAEIRISLTGLSGTEVYNGVLDSGNSVYSIEMDLKRGLYILSVIIGNEVHTARFMKE